MVRAQVEFEATARILSGDNATFMLHLRVCVACFAALDVLSVGAYESVCRVEATLYWRFARVRAPRDDCLAQSVSWTSHVHADRLCKYIFRESAR